jgi:hypothetical protein
MGSATGPRVPQDRTQAAPRARVCPVRSMGRTMYDRREEPLNPFADLRLLDSYLPGTFKLRKPFAETRMTNFEGWWSHGNLCQQCRHFLLDLVSPYLDQMTSPDPSPFIDDPPMAKQKAVKPPGRRPAQEPTPSFRR